jgi:hypothetical protein
MGLEIKMAVGLRGQVKEAAISVSGAGDNTIVAAVAGKIITVVALLLTNGVATAQNVIVKDGTAGTALTGAMPLNTAGVPMFLDEKSDFEYFSTSNPANNLVLNLLNATLVTGSVWYILD